MIRACVVMSNAVHVYVSQEAGRQPAFDKRGERFVFCDRRGTAVDHGPDGRAIDGANERGRFGDAVDEIGFAFGERFDAISEAGAVGVGRNCGKRRFAALARRQCAGAFGKPPSGKTCEGAGVSTGSRVAAASASSSPGRWSARSGH